MKKAIFVILFPLLGLGQNVYDLPLFIIDTEGRQIVDEPKVAAKLKVINNGSDKKNSPTDTPNEYDGYIGIEFRGSSSQGFPKKPYGFETWDKNGNDIDASFFDWPAEEDWILYPSYNEKSMIHNVLSMRLANEIGMYASRTKYVEVFVNNNYQGVYVLMEKIKKSDGRVNINKLDVDEESGEDLTGGYIIKVDKATGSNIGAWESGYTNPPTNYNRSYYLYEYPSDITTIQKSYIRNYIRDFEDVMSAESFSDSTEGYHKYIDPQSFVKFILINEVSKNVDGYRISTFMHKDKNGKLKAGPVWDFDIAYGNGNYCDGNLWEGWAYKFNYVCGEDNWLVPFWWEKLLTDPAFQLALKKEYTIQREFGVLKNENINAIIDQYAAEISNAQVRNYQKWQTLGRYVWPQPQPIPSTWEGEVAELKEWLRKRLIWLDANIGKDSSKPLSILSDEDFEFTTYPNPVGQHLNIRLKSANNRQAFIFLYNTIGQEIHRSIGNLNEGSNEISIDLQSIKIEQIAYLKVISGENTFFKKIVKQ